MEVVCDVSAAETFNPQKLLQGVKERGVGCGVHCKDVCWALIWNVSCGVYMMNVCTCVYMCVCTCACVCTYV